VLRANRAFHQIAGEGEIVKQRFYEIGDGRWNDRNCDGCSPSSVPRRTC